MKIDLVVFDMAGTTVRDRDEVQTCFESAIKSKGLKVSPDQIRSLQGWSKRKVFQLLWTEHLGVGHPDIEVKVDETYQSFKSILENHYITHPVVPQPFTEEVFAKLKAQGIKIALTTGFYREVTELLLSQLNWKSGSKEEALIDASICSDDVKHGRPAPDMILLAMERLGIEDPMRVMKVGDTPSDLQSGKAAQVAYTLGVTNGTHSRDQLGEFDNDGLLRDLSEILDFVDHKVDMAG